MAFTDTEIWILLAWFSGAITTELAARAFGISLHELYSYGQFAKDEGRAVAEERAGRASDGAVAG